MSELIFVIKCFIYTILITLLMQVKISGVSVEARLNRLLTDSRVTAYLQDASDGGTRLFLDGYYTAKNFVLDSTRSLRSSAESQDNRASR